MDLTPQQAIKVLLACLYLLSAQDKHLSLGVLINTISLSSPHFHKGSRLPLGTQPFVGLTRAPLLCWRWRCGTCCALKKDQPASQVGLTIKGCLLLGSLCRSRMHTIRVKHEDTVGNKEHCKLSQPLISSPFCPLPNHKQLLFSFSFIYIWRVLHI